MRPVQATRAKSYEQVSVVAWDCRVCAGDAQAAWLACVENRRAVQHDARWGWVGRVASNLDLIGLAALAAKLPWAAIAEIPGLAALSVSASKGDVEALERALAGDSSAFFAAIPGWLGPQLATRLGIGMHLPFPVAAACSTGLYGLLAAADLVEHGTCTHALAGAADRSLTPLLLAGFASLGVLCGDRAPQAFATSTGFAPAEGAGMLALARDGAWRLKAGVRLGDAGHETHFDDPLTLITALTALWSELPEPDLIITHGTGTGTGDAYERQALDAGPWSACRRLSCKPVIGHCLGASGIVELAIGLESSAQRLWKISLGFGGHLAAVALERRR